MGDIGTVVGMMSIAVAGLSAAVARMWTLFHAELQDCKKDRGILLARADDNEGKLSELRDYVNSIRRGDQPPIV